MLAASRSAHRKWIAGTIVGFVRIVALCAQDPAPSPSGPAAARQPVTFNRDIAPIVFTNCATCHRPGGGAPFTLLTYDDVRRRAQQVALVTRTRYMPPWKPEPDHGEFSGVRRLSNQEIALIQQWIAQGIPLLVGTNTVILRAWDAKGASAWGALVVVRR